MLEVKDACEDVGAQDGGGFADAGSFLLGESDSKFVTQFDSERLEIEWMKCKLRENFVAKIFQLLDKLTEIVREGISFDYEQR